MKLFRRAVLFVLVAAACGCLAVAQQQSSAQSTDEQSASSSQQNPAQPIREAQRDLAHASNEAAGEEKDETKEFKESPSVKWVASHTGLGLKTAYWVLVLLNFVAIAALVVWGWKKNVPAMFRMRSENIRKNLDEARRASDDANRRLADIETRLSRLDTEISEMRQKAEAEGVAEEERIRVAAEEDRRKVIEAAEQEIDSAAKAARRELKAYAASLAVSLAEKRIHIDQATDRALVSGFVRDLGSNGTGKAGR